MTPADVPDELVEKAADAMSAAYDEITQDEISTMHQIEARHALAAVMPEIQAQARKEAEQERDAARAEAAEYLRMASSVSQSASRIVSSRAARLTATTDYPGWHADGSGKPVLDPPTNEEPTDG